MIVLHQQPPVHHQQVRVPRLQPQHHQPQLRKKTPPPPKLTAQPTVNKGQNTITVKFKTNEKSKIQIKYTLGKTVKTLNDGLASTHTITIGKTTPLLAGTIYKITIIATDSSGNKATIYNKNIRTQGVNYTVKITDSSGEPLTNYPVQLFSNPIDAKTDANGVATFKDVTPGTHTLVFTLDGLTMRQSVIIPQPSSSNNNYKLQNESVNNIKLPIKFAASNIDSPKTLSNYVVQLILIAMALGAAVITLIRAKWFKDLFIKTWTRIMNVFRSNNDNEAPTIYNQ